MRGNYLLWSEPNTKKPASTVLQEGIAAYIARFDVAPRVVLVSVDNDVRSDDIEIVPRSHVLKHDYWIGQVRPE